MAKDDTYDMAKLLSRISQTIGEEKWHLQAAVKRIQIMQKELDAMRAENERMQTSLRVIRTWASMDTKEEHYDRPRLLVAEDVMECCDRGLGYSKKTTD